MRILMGIGNPGWRYKSSRHNVGFMMLDYFANAVSLSFKPSQFDYYFAEGKISGNDFILIKPTTYVNKSGIAAMQIINKYEIDLQDLLVVVDDLNLEFSKLRIRKSGGDGGHNGVSSIIYHLSSDMFPRLRIGIGNTFEKGRMSGYVLENFNRKQKKILAETFKNGSVLLEDFIKGGISQMLDTNSRLMQSEKDNNNQSKIN